MVHRVKNGQSSNSPRHTPALHRGRSSTTTSTAVLNPVGRGQWNKVRIGQGRFYWKRWVFPTALLLSDVLLALSIAVVAVGFQRVWGNGELSNVALAAVFPTVPAWVVLRGLLGLYPGYGAGPVEELRRHAHSIFALAAVLAIFALGLKVGDLLSRSWLALFLVGLLVLGPFVRSIVKRGLKRAGLWGKPVVILGYRQAGTGLATLLEREWGLGYNPVAVFDYRLLDAGGEASEEADHHDVLADVAALAAEQNIDTAIFAMPHTRREQLAEVVERASESFRNVLIIPNLSGVTNSAVVARDLAGVFAVEIKHNLLDPWAQRLKRAMDLCGAIFGGLLMVPVLLAIVVLIKLDSPGPALYGHRRIGAKDESFLCWKFRTMYVDAERSLAEYLQGNPALQAEWEQNHKLKDDPRVTRVGRFLRRTSLDELPQLLNVLRGEMSLTGPRPIVEAEISKYGTEYGLYRRITPGMSGLWQVGGRSNTDYSERVEMDSYYVRNWSVWLDIVILARTLRTVLRGRGAY